MKKALYTFKAIILLPSFFFYYLIVGKKVRKLIVSDFRRYCKWQNRPFTILGFCYLFAQLLEFRSICYNRLRAKQIFISWLWKGQTNLSIACHDIGPGFVIQHGYSTVIAAKQIGKNFHVNQCVNIVWNRDQQCIIGDNVTVCCGAIIVGGVKIGDNVTIGAGAVVVKDVPNNAVVVGQPCRILAKK